MAGFTLATLAAAFAPSVEVLVIARTLQAVTGASAIPNGTAMVRAWLPTARQGRALGAIGAGADKLALGRLAEATVHRFIHDVADQLQRMVDAIPEDERLWPRGTG